MGLIALIARRKRKRSRLHHARVLQFAPCHSALLIFRGGVGCFARWERGSFVGSQPAFTDKPERRGLHRRRHLRFCLGSAGLVTGAMAVILFVKWVWNS